MFSLSLPGITVTGSRTESVGNASGDEKLMLVVDAVCEGKPICPKCSASNPYVHGTLKQEVMDFSNEKSLDIPVPQVLRINLARKRWKCTSCGKTFLHPLAWMDEDQRSSNRFLEHLATTALEKNFSELSREVGIHEKTVRNIFYRFYQDVDTAKIHAPQHMGVGTMEIAGVPRAVILNLQNGASLEYLSNNVLDKYRECFQRMTSPQDVELVITGFTPDCRPLFSEFFPLAKIVIDRSHVEDLADDVMESVRKRVRGEIASRRTKTKLMSDKLVLFTRRNSMPSWAATQLKAWRHEFPLICAVYDQKESLLEFCESTSPEMAKARLDAWKGSIPEVMKPYWSDALALLTDWQKEVLAYFDLSKELQDAFARCQATLEEAGTKFRAESGRGHSFEALRIKLKLASSEK